MATKAASKSGSGSKGAKARTTAVRKSVAGRAGGAAAATKSKSSGVKSSSGGSAKRRPAAKARGGAGKSRPAGKSVATRAESLLSAAGTGISEFGSKTVDVAKKLVDKGAELIHDIMPGTSSSKGGKSGKGSSRKSK